MPIKPWIPSLKLGWPISFNSLSLTDITFMWLHTMPKFWTNYLQTTWWGVLKSRIFLIHNVTPSLAILVYQILNLDHSFITWYHIMQLPVAWRLWEQSSHSAAAAAVASLAAALLPTGHFSVGIRLHHSTWARIPPPSTHKHSAPTGV